MTQLLCQTDLRPSGLGDFVRTNTGGADLKAGNAAIDPATNPLQVRAEGALRVFHHVHTDTALFLGQTATGNMTADSLALSANVTNFYSTPQSLATAAAPDVNALCLWLVNNILSETKRKCPSATGDVQKQWWMAD